MVPSNVGHLQAVFNVAAFELARQLRRPDPDRGPVSLRNFAVALAERKPVCSRFFQGHPRPRKRTLGLLKATASISVFADPDCPSSPFGLSVAP
jgi:hypothetical protein